NTINNAASGANQREQDLPVAIFLLLSLINAHTTASVLQRPQGEFRRVAQDTLYCASKAIMRKAARRA
ncbi:hypothetical protein J8J07_22405, partial [Mycobacterium tuberculosis]|nr:hypothetical protein [Mycobacterium tuberculosis]